MANQNRYVVAFGTFLVSPIDRSELFIVAFGGSFLDVVAFGGTHQGVMAHLGRTILEKSFSFILGLKISQQRLAFIEQYDDSTHQTGEVRNECVIVAKRHQKFPSARGYGPFMVPSRCHCLAWRSLFGAVPFWPLLARVQCTNRVLQLADTMRNTREGLQTGTHTAALPRGHIRESRRQHRRRPSHKAGAAQQAAVT